MRVLSLFDGMACGALALQAAGVGIESYDAFEIDKYAITTSSHNFPFIKHHGDVFEADFTKFEGVDLVCGGSPCTYWSIAQTCNRETKAEGMGWELFQQYVRAIKEAKPKFFIYENNKSMSKAIRASIDEAFGFEAVLINSALVSAQSRQRLYWVGRRNPDGTYSKVNVEQPIDRGILLKDVLDGVTDRNKARSVICSIGRTTTREYFIKAQGTMTFEPVCPLKSEKARCVTAGYANKGAAHILESYYSDNPCKQKWDSVAEPVAINTTPDGKSQTVKAQAQQTNEDNIIVYAGGTFGASGVAEPVAINATDDGEKARTLMAGYYKYGTATLITNEGFKGGTTAVADPVRVGTYPNNAKNQDKHDSQQYRIYSTEGKGITLCGNGGGMGAKTGLYAIPVEFDGEIPIKAISAADGKTYRVHEVKNGLITIKGKQYPINLADGFYIIRKLTVTECKRLQTVPEWYEFPVSDSQAYKMLGNGWTVEVIAHLLNACLSDNGESQPKVGEQMRFF